MRPICFALALSALLATPALLAQTPRRDGGTLAAVYGTAGSPPAHVSRPYPSPPAPRGSKTRAVILYGSALVGGVGMVIATKPGEGDGEPLVPALRVPLAFVAGAFIGLVISSQILRLVDD